MASTIRIGNQHLTVEVSSLGAEMQSLTSADGRSWLWHGDAAFWGGRSPILFPIVGKAPDDQVGVDGTLYPMAQHGIARRAEFTLAKSTATMCRHEFASSEATKAVYPFDFLLALEHAVEDQELTVTAHVTNRSDRPMPFGLGFHPAFAWPLPGSEGRPHVVTLDNGGEPALARLKGGLLNAERLASPFAKGSLTLDHSMFEADAMIFPEGAGHGLTYGADGGEKLTFRFDNLPNLALWTKPGAPFLCVEPWHGMAAEAGKGHEIAARPYSMVLGLGQTMHFSFAVELPA